MIATALSAAALLMLSSEDEGLFWLSRTSSLMEYDLPPTFTPPAALTLSAASWAPCSENLATYGRPPTGTLTTMVTEGPAPALDPRQPLSASPAVTPNASQACPFIIPSPPLFCR